VHSNLTTYLYSHHNQILNHYNAYPNRFQKITIIDLVGGIALPIMGKAAGYNREVCIDTLQFAADGRVLPVRPTHNSITFIK